VYTLKCDHIWHMFLLKYVKLLQGTLTTTLKRSNTTRMCEYSSLSKYWMCSLIILYSVFYWTYVKKEGQCTLRLINNFFSYKDQIKIIVWLSWLYRLYKIYTQSTKSWFKIYLPDGVWRQTYLQKINCRLAVHLELS